MVSQASVHEEANMTDFLDQLSGSGAANALTAFVFLLGWILRNKCKHSKCSGHSLCCDIEINDDESDIEGGEFPRKVEEDLLFLHTPDHSSVSQEHKKTAQVDL